MTHGSLFSGIGGFDLAAEWLGWENVFHCEYAEFPRKILSYHFPNSISYNDIKETDFSIHEGQIDVLSGGFPCQPYSQAGKRKGKNDERHLWPEMLRSICEIKPRYVVGENVRGLITWNGGLVFDEVQADLEAEGYEVVPFLLPACGVNAPHQRYRIFFVAHNATYTDSWRIQTRPHEKVLGKSDRETKASRLINESLSRRLTKAEKCKYNFTTCTNRTMCEDCEDGSNYEEWTFTNPNLLKRGDGNGKGTPEGSAVKKNGTKPLNEPRSWESFPTEPPICGGNDGLSRELDGITFSKWRQESIKAYGNAVVPQVVYPIFKAIQTLENE